MFKLPDIAIVKSTKTILCLYLLTVAGLLFNSYFQFPSFDESCSVYAIRTNQAESVLLGRSGFIYTNHFLLYLLKVFHLSPIGVIFSLKFISLATLAAALVALTYLFWSFFGSWIALISLIFCITHPYIAHMASQISPDNLAWFWTSLFFMSVANNLIPAISFALLGIAVFTKEASILFKLFSLPKPLIGSFAWIFFVFILSVFLLDFSRPIAVNSFMLSEYEPKLLYNLAYLYKNVGVYWCSFTILAVIWILITSKRMVNRTHAAILYSLFSGQALALVFTRIGLEDSRYIFVSLLFQGLALGKLFQIITQMRSKFQKFGSLLIVGVILMLYFHQSYSNLYKVLDRRGRIDRYAISRVQSLIDNDVLFLGKILNTHAGMLCFIHQKKCFAHELNQNNFSEIETIVDKVLKNGGKVYLVESDGQSISSARAMFNAYTFREIESNVLAITK